MRFSNLTDRIAGQTFSKCHVQVGSGRVKLQPLTISWVEKHWSEGVSSRFDRLLPFCTLEMGDRTDTVGGRANLEGGLDGYAIYLGVKSYFIAEFCSLSCFRWCGERFIVQSTGAGYAWRQIII